MASLRQIALMKASPQVSRLPKRGSPHAGWPHWAALLLIVGQVAALRPAVGDAGDVNGGGAAEAGGRVSFPGWPIGTSNGRSWPRFGRFESLPSLACNVEGPLSRDGRRGGWMQPAGASAPRCVVRGNGTCGSPLAALTAVMTPCDLPEGDGICKIPRSVASWVNFSGQVWHAYETVVKRVSTIPLRSDADLGAMVYEAEVAGMLDLHRNTVRGSVARQTAAFDVVAVTRETSGVCLCRYCGTVAAVDTSAGGIYSHNDTHIAVPVVTVEPLNGGPLEVVLDSGDGILSLGRAVLANAAWLTPHPEWRYLAGTTVTLSVFPSRRPGDSVPTELALTQWRLLGADAKGTRSLTRWLQAIAFVFCAPPEASFLREARRLCADQYTADAESLNDVASSPDQLPWTDGSPAGYRGRRAVWGVSLGSGSFSNRNRTVLTNISSLDLPAKDRPCWLAGRHSREINPASHDEAVLARRIGSASILVPGRPRHGRVQKMQGLRDDDTAHGLWTMSQTYDKAVFGAELPADPAIAEEVAIIVVLLLVDLIAIVRELPQYPDQQQWGSMRLVMKILLSLFLMTELGWLAFCEAKGDAWRAAATRSVLETAPPGDSFYGLPVRRTETLFLIARTGYRHLVLLGVAFGVAVVYVIVPLAVVYAP